VLIRIWGTLFLLILASFYTIYAQITSTEDEVSENSERIKSEVKIQTHRYLEKRAVEKLGPKHTRQPLKLTPAEEKIASELPSPFAAENLPPLPDDVQDVVLANKPFLDPTEPSYDPNDSRPHNQTRIDALIRRLQIIHDVPSDYYRERMLGDFRRQMEDSSTRNETDQLATWILEEIDNMEEALTD